ncbi:hypothetical protein C2134_15675 [Chromobacterium sinusclupearum]|uniref:Transposase DDE domain-containing protein n=1 Tax=Chromobacterium sinusclupearum TaxID=2077146 RepID=A0A2K4MJL9_9NEIS|nr:hypothetical protein C2134_15675 [Chromobacterium sinusclupearum]
MIWLAKPRGQEGRSQAYLNAAIRLCFIIKNLFLLALRQSIGFIQSLFKLVCLDWSVLDNSTLSRRQQTLLVQTPYQKSSGGLHLLGLPRLL